MRRLHVTCIWWSVSGKQQGQEKEKHLCKNTKFMQKEEWTECTLHALVYIPKPHVLPTQSLEVLLLAVLVIIVTTMLLLAVLVIIVTTNNFTQQLRLYNTTLKLPQEFFSSTSVSEAVISKRSLGFSQKMHTTSFHLKLYIFTYTFQGKKKSPKDCSVHINRNLMSQESFRSYRFFYTKDIYVSSHRELQIPFSEKQTWI